MITHDHDKVTRVNLPCPDKNTWDEVTLCRVTRDKFNLGILPRVGIKMARVNLPLVYINILVRYYFVGLFWVNLTRL